MDEVTPHSQLGKVEAAQHSGVERHGRRSNVDTDLDAASLTPRTPPPPTDAAASTSLNWERVVINDWASVFVNITVGIDTSVIEFEFELDFVFLFGIDEEVEVVVVAVVVVAVVAATAVTVAAKEEAGEGVGAGLGALIAPPETT